MAAAPWPFATCSTASSYPSGLLMLISTTSDGLTWTSMPFFPFTAYALSRALQRIVPFCSPWSVVIDPVMAPNPAAAARTASTVITLLRIFITPWPSVSYLSACAWFRAFWTAVLRLPFGNSS